VSLQRSPDPLSGFKGPISKGRGGDGREGEMRGGQWSALQGKAPERERGGKTGNGEGERRDRGRGGEGKENGDSPPTIFGLEVALTMDGRTDRHVIVISNARLCNAKITDSPPPTVARWQN